MNPISSIGSLPTSIPGLSSNKASQPGAFQQVLDTAFNTVEGLNQNAGSAVQDFLSGKNDDLHTTILATQQAEMAFQLGLQVRNKVISAYQEIMKMQL